MPFLQKIAKSIGLSLPHERGRIRWSNLKKWISNGFLSPNDIHRLENMDLIPSEKGGDDYYLNGGYVKLQDAGKQVTQPAGGQPPGQKQEPDTQEQPEEKPENRKRGRSK